jgi:hypothetical protein
LIDPFAGFRMLLGAGFDPKNILVVGESAGAFAVLALVRYLKELRDEYGIDAGMPGGIAVISVRCFSTFVTRIAHCRAAAGLQYGSV